MGRGVPGGSTSALSADPFSGDLGALEREAAVSDEGSGSETDEDEHPLRLKPFRIVDAPAAADAAAGLAKHGAAAVAGVVAPKAARLVGRACGWLRDQAQMSYMFAAPSTATASAPCAAEAVHVDDTVLALVRRGDKKASSALRAAIDGSERAVRAAHAKDLESRTELEALLRACVQDVKHEIGLQRQAAAGGAASGSRPAAAGREVGIGEFGPQERERVMELLLSQERVVTLLYERTFPARPQDAVLPGSIAPEQGDEDLFDADLPVQIGV